MADVRTEKARRLALAQIIPGERLVWWGAPGGGVVRSGAGFGGVIFMTLWTLFSVAWTGLAFVFTSFGDDQAEGWFRLFPLFGLPFILVGIVGLSGALRGMGGESYALTDRRLLVIRGRAVTEYLPADFRRMERDGSDKRGSIGFAHSAIEQGAKPTVWLYEINSPAEVEALIRKHLLSWG